MARKHTLTSRTMLLLERASYPLVLLPALTDYLETGSLPRSPREYVTEVTVGLLILAYVLFVRRARQRLEEAEELQRGMTGSVVHDLKHPVSAMKGSLEILRDPGQSPEIHREMLEIAERSCATQLRFIDLILETSRLESGELPLKPEPVEPAALAAEAIRELEGAASSKGVEMRVSSAPQPGQVFADRLLLVRVLMNLLSNAIKYTPRGGVITVRISTGGSPDARIHVFEVDDSGPGIPPEKAALLFRKYSRLDAPGLKVPGTGIGLYFCRLAVTAHGGDITFSSAPEGGSSFRFTVPSAAQKS